MNPECDLSDKNEAYDSQCGRSSLNSTLEGPEEEQTSKFAVFGEKFSQCTSEADEC